MELFIKGLPENTNPEDLRQYFAGFGNIHQLDVKRDETGRCRGFAFVTFNDPTDIDNVMSVSEHRFMGTTISIRINTKHTDPDNHKPDVRKIFIGGLPPTCSEEDLITHFAAFGEILSCDLKKDPNTGVTRGFAFVVFQEQEAAAAAITNYDNNMINDKWVEVKSCGPNGNVDAKPSDERTIFVGGLPWDVTEEQVREHFGSHGPIEKVDLKMNQATGSPKGYCFVTFQDASVAKSILSVEHIMQGKRVDVKTAVIGIGKHSVRDKQKGGKGKGGDPSSSACQTIMLAPPGKGIQPVYGQQPMILVQQPGGGYQQILQQPQYIIQQPGVQLVQAQPVQQFVQMQQVQPYQQVQQVVSPGGAGSPGGLIPVGMSPVSNHMAQFQDFNLPDLPPQFDQQFEQPQGPPPLPDGPPPGPSPMAPPIQPPPQGLISYQIPNFEEPTHMESPPLPSYQPMGTKGGAPPRFNPY